MPKFSITFSRKRWEHLVKNVEADNLEAAEKIVSGYMQHYTFSEEDWDCGELVGVYIAGDQTPEIEITNTSDDTQKFYPEDTAWPDAEPAPLPPPLPRHGKEFAFRARTQLHDPDGEWPHVVRVEAPDKEAALKAAKDFYCHPTAEFELLSEADLAEAPKEPPS